MYQDEGGQNLEGHPRVSAHELNVLERRRPHDRAKLIADMEFAEG